MKKLNLFSVSLISLVLFALTGCACFVDSLNRSHQKLGESAKDSPVAIHKEDIKPIPASSFEPKHASE